jgi:hypothetical protein
MVSSEVAHRWHSKGILMDISSGRDTASKDLSNPAFTVDIEKGLKIRDFPSSELAAQAEVFINRLAIAEGINVPGVHQRNGKRMVTDYLPGRSLAGRLGSDTIQAIARLQARIHDLDWPEYADREVCIGNYRHYFNSYTGVYRNFGFIDDSSEKKLLQRFEALVPLQFHPALIHNDLWSGNVLVYRDDLYLIDYASVNFLALESDLLNSSRCFHTASEFLFHSDYSLRTRYVKAYADQGRRMQEVLRTLTRNHRFYAAFNAMRKGSNMLRRESPARHQRLLGMSFPLRRLRQTWKLLGT